MLLKGISVALAKASPVASKKVNLMTLTTTRTATLLAALSCALSATVNALGKRGIIYDYTNLRGAATSFRRSKAILFCGRLFDLVLV